MAEVEFKLTGWKAVVVLVAIIGLLGYRFVSQKDLTNDQELMIKVEMELTTLYLPGQVEQLKKAQETGDSSKMDELAKAITTTKLKVHAVEASQPMFDFTSPREVVLRVTWSLEDGKSNPARKTNYYLFEYSALTDHWRYIHETTSIRYYLNFM